MQTLHAKRIAIILAVVATATATWAVARPSLVDPLRFSSIALILWPVVGILALTAVCGVAFMLLESRWDRIAAITASWAAFILFWRPDPWYASVLPLFALVWYEASRSIRRDLADRKRLNVRVILMAGMKPILLGIFIMLSLGFYLLPGAQDTDLDTVSGGIQSSLETAYQNPIVEARLAELPPSLQQQFRRDMAQAADGFVHKWLGPVSSFIPPLLAFALFLALWSVNFLLREPAAWLGVGIFALLKKIGFVHIQEQDVKEEIISLV